MNVVALIILMTGFICARSKYHTVPLEHITLKLMHGPPSGSSSPCMSFKVICSRGTVWYLDLAHMKPVMRIIRATTFMDCIHYKIHHYIAHDMILSLSFGSWLTFCSMLSLNRVKTLHQFT